MIKLRTKELKARQALECDPARMFSDWCPLPAPGRLYFVKNLSTFHFVVPDDPAPENDFDHWLSGGAGTFREEWVRLVCYIYENGERAYYGWHSESRTLAVGEIG